MSPLIKPDTLVAYIDGAHFYNTHHKFSDYDIIAVELTSIDKVLAGIKPKPKQVHGTPWLGNNVDITYYDIEHFMNLIAKGNIQLIEKVLKSLPDSLVYYSPMYKDIGLTVSSPIQRFAELALKQTNWGHVRGWMRKTMQKVDAKGLNVKRAMLMCRMIYQTKLYLSRGRFECQFPQLLNHKYLFGTNYQTFEDLWQARRSGIQEIPPKIAIPVESLLQKGFEEVDHLLENYEPEIEHDIHSVKQRLLYKIRVMQMKEWDK